MLGGRQDKVSKVRADQLLVARGLAESRTRAQALIMGGKVYVGDRRVAKAGDMLAGPMLEALDADRDGKVSRGEWVSVARRVFAACEKDAEGRVDQKALGAGLNGMMPKAPDVPMKSCFQSTPVLFLRRSEDRSSTVPASSASTTVRPSVLRRTSP